MTEEPTVGTARVQPVLDAAQLTVLEPFGSRRQVAAGDVLFADGDTSYDFVVVLSGAVDVVSIVDGVEELIVRQGPGRYVGELGLLTGQRVFLTARVVEAGEVLLVPPDAFRRMIATVPDLGDGILAELIWRRDLLLSTAARTVRVVGSRYSPESLAMREFLARNRLPHDWLDVDEDVDVQRLLGEFGIGTDELPVVLTSTAVMRSATPGQVAQHLGLTIESIPDRCFDLVVVGAGPAGLAAAVYGASEGLHTLAVESEAPGGQAGTSSRIENYLGFPAGVSGAELTDLAMAQALKFGARLTTPCDVVSLEERGGHLVLSLSDGTELAARSVVAATGARYRRLEVDELTRYEGRGVYYAATAVEARLAGEGHAVVVGGGNSAGQAAMYLAGTCSGVTLVLRGPDLYKSMSSYLADRILVHPNIVVTTDTTIAGLGGDSVLEYVRLRTAEDEVEIPGSGLFSFIGATPQSAWLSGLAATCPNGFVRTDRHLVDEDLGGPWTALGREPLPFETSQPGLFAVGDVRLGSMKRVASAVGEGSAAVRSVHDHLSFAST